MSSVEQLRISDDSDDTVTVIWTEYGLPMFVADRDNICDIVEDMGFSLYYLLANHSATITSTSKGANNVNVNTTKTVRTSKMFKVVNNIVGRTVSPISDPLGDDVITVSEIAEYNLPVIPLAMIDKLDEFFRLIDTKHGTESIVLLTFDETKEDSDGWGILVPDQTNTSVHCNYDPGSIQEHKPDNVVIVGSVHSHPGMAAYASGTDHNDQADFDGIHITFGWQKSVNNGATQYHIEMQMAGHAYTLKPEDVFETIEIDREPDPEVVAWSEKVKKALPPQQSWAGVTHSSITANYPTPTTSTTSTQSTTRPGTASLTNSSRVKRFEHFPDVWKTIGIANNIVLAEVIPNHLGSYDCPACGYDINEADVKDGWCAWCLMPVVSKHSLETNVLDDILSDLMYWCYTVDFNRDSNVYLWITSGGAESTLMPLGAGTLSQMMTTSTSTVPSPSRSADYYEDQSPFGSRVENGKAFVCCGTPLDREKDCECKPRITPADVLDFEHYLERVNQYADNAKCTNCELYYSPQCPAYFNNLLNYVIDPKITPEEFDATIDGVDCALFEPYTFDQDPNSYSIYDRDY